MWTSPAFEPTVRDGNLFGRGTADDKGQVHIHLKALEALYKSEGSLPLNVKVIIEGEEEVGSVSLWDFVLKNKELLRADALVVSDTAMLAKGVPSITYGLRGLDYFQVEITGPAQDLHSGVFGGAVPNPITILAEMIAKLHDKNFHVTVPGFYDDVAKISRRNTKRSLRCLGGKRIFARRWALRNFAARRDSRLSSSSASANARVEWHMGRLHGRRLEDCDSFESVCENFCALGAESGSAENCQAGRSGTFANFCRRA